MLKVDFELEGLAPLQFSKAVTTPRNTGESHDAHEKRTWMERLHTTASGQVFIPPQAIKAAMISTGRFLRETVPGKGKSEYTKHFTAGVMSTDPMLLHNNNGKPITKADVKPLDLFVPSDGKRGGGKRVNKTFPMIETWSAKGAVYIIDPLLIDKPSKVHEYMKHAGQFIGLLAFRPENGGYFGRFLVKSFETSPVT